ncbi:hypothetical protein NFI96_028395, partial [Prochilodus magdalenae]
FCLVLLKGCSESATGPQADVPWSSTLLCTYSSSVQPEHQEVLIGLLRVFRFNPTVHTADMQSDKHLHTTLYTVTTASCQPEFTAVSFVNERQITRYDSENKTLTPMHPWVREALSNHHWEKYKEKHLSEYRRLREELRATMKSFGRVGGELVIVLMEF